MKGIDLFCASPASTAICASMDHRSMVRHSGRAIDRHNPRIRDGQRRSRALPPYSSLPPILPEPYNQKSRKSSAKPTDTPRTSSAKSTGTRRKSSAKAADLITSPPGSSRYLLDHNTFFDVLSDFDPNSALVPFQHTRPQSLKSNGSSAFKSSSSSPNHDQVVVLRVSLHCKGCEGKVRKHISRMEGVTSFSIDFATKKVTVIGNVTPLGVLASVSRVKRAQLWPSPTSSPLIVTSPY